MSGILALMLAQAAAAVMGAATEPAPVYSLQLADLFMSACFDGSAKLNATDAEPARFESLPKSLRSRLAAPDKTQVWKLRSGGESYLYVLEYQKTDQNRQICGLASDSLPIAPAVDTIARRVGATVDRSTDDQMIEWWRPDQGYMALASRLRGYTVLQVNQLSEHQRKEATRFR